MSIERLAQIVGVGLVFCLFACDSAWATEREGGAVSTVQAFPPGRMAGVDLARFCEQATDLDAGFCAGYVTAIADVMIDQPLYGFRACLYPSVRTQQIMENVIQAMKAPPDRSQFAARAVVADTLSKAFACY